MAEPKGKEKEYRAWIDMRRRCYDAKRPQYANYGARGIKVCPAWLGSFEAFYQDLGAAPSKAHSLDRIDNNGHYEPSNCRWATNVEQGSNRRTNHLLTHNGKAMTITEWSAEIGVSVATMVARVARKLPTDRVLDPYVVPKKTKILFGGEYRTASEWSKILGVPATTIRRRARLGRPIDKYITNRKDK